MIQIRKGIFETNSSSTHAISISQYPIVIDIDTYNKWKNGELVYCGEIPSHNCKFISPNEDHGKEPIYTYKDFENLKDDIRRWDDGDINEFFFKTPSGEEYVFINIAMGYDTEVYR